MLLSKKDVEKAVKKYFKERAIKDLMDYGASKDEGLNDISGPYEEILENLGFEVQGHSAEDAFGDGKYCVYLDVRALTKDRIEIPVKAWDGIEQVTKDICDLLGDYNYCWLSTQIEYNVEISLILNNEYYNESDIHITTFDNFTDAYAFAKQIDVQNPELYECYIYAINSDDYDILDSHRVF